MNENRSVEHREKFPSLKNGRAGGIRTRGLLVPNEALYQAEPRPDLFYFNDLRKLTRPLEDDL